MSHIIILTSRLKNIFVFKIHEKYKFEWLSFKIDRNKNITRKNKILKRIYVR
jgi:hypothetical protein